jgi:glycosyltransferase involved in cell wall biosynthesis
MPAPLPIRILELRSVLGSGGGPEKTILSGAAMSDRERYAITVSYIRDARDRDFSIDQWAARIRVDYAEIRERHSFDFSVWKALRKLVRQRGIDIVHAHDYKTNFYAWLLSRATNAIPLSTLHGYTGHSRREQIYYAADKRLLRAFPRLITVSEQLRQELIRTGARPERISTVLNGIDDRRFRRDRSKEADARRALGLSDEHVIVGAVGRLEHQKRFDLIMEAMELLRRRPGGNLLRLVIAGEGSLRSKLEAERSRLGLDDACLILGQRTDVDVLHHAFDAFVQGSDYEGTPNAVLEAMAFETPIVATDVGGTRELVTDGTHGLLVRPGSPADLAVALHRLLSDRAATRDRTRAARQRIEGELSFRARMRAVERVYEALMAGEDNIARHTRVSRATSD